MKKYLPGMMNYLFGLLLTVNILLALATYLIWRFPVFFFAYDNSVNLSRIILERLTNEYVWVIFNLLLPLAAIFAVFSLFVWIYYRKERAISRLGFKNLIAISFTGFFIILMPTIAPLRLEDVRDYKQAEAAKNKRDGVKVSVSQFDIMKLYQSLADDGIQAWRRDPLEVAKFELKPGGALAHLSRPDDKLTVKERTVYETTKTPKVIIELTNSRFKAEITLSQWLRHGEDGIWRVTEYKVIK